MAEPPQLNLPALYHLSYQASAATWPFFSLVTILFGMRCLSRIHIRTYSFGWDDAVLILSWMLAVIRASTFQRALDSTREISIETLPVSLPRAAFWVIFVDAWAFFSIALPKLGVGILLIRIFKPSKWLKVSILTLCILLNIFATVGFIITWAQCDPVAGQWDPFHNPDTVCWNRNIQIIYSNSVSGLSAFMDIAFAVYPGIVIWSLQMPNWKKLCTMALMGLGIASFAFAIVKLYSNTALLGRPDVNQLLYDGIKIGIWNSIENDFVLSAALLPSVPPFFRAAKLLVKTQISSYGKQSLPASDYSFGKSSYNSGRDKYENIEFATNFEPPTGKIQVDREYRVSAQAPDDRGANYSYSPQVAAFGGR